MNQISISMLFSIGRKPIQFTIQLFLAMRKNKHYPKFKLMFLGMELKDELFDGPGNNRKKFMNWLKNISECGVFQAMVDSQSSNPERYKYLENQLRGCLQKMPASKISSNDTESKQSQAKNDLTMESIETCEMDKQESTSQEDVFLHTDTFLPDFELEKLFDFPEK